jgi:succinyl-diaminopimelate desuccinylase
MSDYSSLLAVLSKLISFQTVTHDQKAAATCLEYIASLVSNYGLHTNRYTSNGFESFIISTRDTKHSRLLLQAHLDVVPAHPEQYKLTQKEGKLYGRGVYDMKYAAACYLELLRDLGTSVAEYDIAIMLTTDEEDGGHDGVEYLLNQGYTADMCVLPDSGDEWNIEASAKGYAVATVTAPGKNAHASRPWEGDNAILRLADFIESAKNVFPNTEPLGDTINATMLQAGKAYNQIPDMASVAYDIRFASSSSYEAIKEQFKRLCNEYDTSVQFVAHAAAIQHDVESTGFEEWQAITTQITGVEPNFTHSFAASDARYLVPRGIPTISTRPRGGGHHGGEEWLSEKSFYEFYEVLKHFVISMGKDHLDI